MHPKTVEEYNERYQANLSYAGTGIDTAISLPCPFCAAPDFARAKIIDLSEALTKSHTCAECQRSMRIERHKGNHGEAIDEFVQTGGDAAPDFIPKMRRVVE